MTKTTEVITDIIHTATQAALADDEQIQRQGLADIYETIASVLHVDHRAAPVDLAKKPGATGVSPVAGGKPVADGTPTDKLPAVSGCPSLGPKVFPSGADGTAPAEDDDKAKRQAEYFRRKYSFCDGLFPIRYTNTEDGVMASCWITGRRFTMDLDNNERDDGGHDCAAVIKDNGNVVATIETQRGKSISAQVCFAAFKAYVKNLSGSGKFSPRGGYLKQAFKRENQSLINKELANNGLLQIRTRAVSLQPRQPEVRPVVGPSEDGGARAGASAQARGQGRPPRLRERRRVVNAFVTVFKYAADRADAAYRKAIASGVGEDAALEERKAEFYYGLFRFFFDPNLSKWNAAGGAA